MYRQILIGCLPFLAAIAVSVVVLRLLLLLSGARLKLSHLRNLHRDQHGGVQSLSFVLTVPVFIMVMMFIVQLSQVTIAKIVVEYAAFSAARSAIVWIPAALDEQLETENRIGERGFAAETSDDPGGPWEVFEVQDGSRKMQKIRHAAAVACMSISPSRNTGASLDEGEEILRAIQAVYPMVSPDSVENSKIPTRLRNKLAWSMSNTRIKLQVHHKDAEPPLAMYNPEGEFQTDEIGWQDQIELTVYHDFALLPGPGRLLSRRVRPASGSDRVADTIESRGTIYVYPMKATVRLNNEGQKSVLRYVEPSSSTGSGGYSSFFGSFQ